MQVKSRSDLAEWGSSALFFIKSARGPREDPRYLWALHRGTLHRVTPRQAHPTKARHAPQGLLGEPRRALQAPSAVSAPRWMGITLLRGFSTRSI